MLNSGALFLIKYDTRFTYSLVALFVGLQAVFLVPAMFATDQYPDYYDTVLPYVFSCDIEEFPERNGNATRNPFTWWLRCVSFSYTENPNIFLMPFAIGILPLTYMIASKLTGDRLVGIIALAAIVFNPLWKDWAPTQTYDMLWAFLLLSSFYLLLVSHQRTSALMFSVGALAKTVTLLYTPLWIVKVIQQRAWGALVLMVIIFGLGIMVLDKYDISMNQVIGNEFGFYPERFEDSMYRIFGMLWKSIPILVASIILYQFFKPKIQTKGVKDVLLWISYSILTVPIIHVFTLQTQYPYRFVVLGVFMSIFLAISIVNMGRFIIESREKKFLVK